METDLQRLTALAKSANARLKDYDLSFLRNSDGIAFALTTEGSEDDSGPMCNDVSAVLYLFDKNEKLLWFGIVH